MAAGGGEAFDGNDRFAGSALHRGQATARSFAVDVDSACAAETHAAAEFRTGQLELIAQIPEQGHARIAGEFFGRAVHLQTDHERSLYLVPGGPLCWRSLATRPVQPVWWLAPRPLPVSPWKYS